MKIVGFARFVFGPGEAFGDRAGEVVEDASGERGRVFAFASALGEALELSMPWM